MSLQGASLGSASAGVSLRITVEHNLATTVVACLYLTSVLVNAKNLWYFISYIHNSIFIYYTSCYDAKIIKIMRTDVILMIFNTNNRCLSFYLEV